MRDVARVLDWRVVEVGAALGEKMSQRVVELVPDLEVLDAATLCSVDWPDWLAN